MTATARMAAQHAIAIQASWPVAAPVEVCPYPQAAHGLDDGRERLVLGDPAQRVGRVWAGTNECS